VRSEVIDTSCAATWLGSSDHKRHAADRTDQRRVRHRYPFGRPPTEHADVAQLVALRAAPDDSRVGEQGESKPARDKNAGEGDGANGM
jgi:hypothetical protein